jgi:hypothetical protein
VRRGGGATGEEEREETKGIGEGRTRGDLGRAREGIGGCWLGFSSVGCPFYTDAVTK